MRKQKTKKPMFFHLLGRGVLVALLLAGAAPAPAQRWPGGCFICWEDEWDHEEGLHWWYRADAEEFGYRNCSAVGSSCGNWEPLCENQFIQDPDCWWDGINWRCG